MGVDSVSASHNWIRSEIYRNPCSYWRDSGQWRGLRRAHVDAETATQNKDFKLSHGRRKKYSTTDEHGTLGKDAVMIDPEAWPLWLQFLLFSPMIVGIVSLWLSSAKEPKWRAVQIGCIIYAFAFVIFVVWKSVIGYAVAALSALGFVIFLFLKRRKSN